jgi:hypothetical protein
MSDLRVAFEAPTSTSFIGFSSSVAQAQLSTAGRNRRAILRKKFYDAPIITRYYNEIRESKMPVLRFPDSSAAREAVKGLVERGSSVLVRRAVDHTVLETLAVGTLLFWFGHENREL